MMIRRSTLLFWTAGIIVALVATGCGGGGDGESMDETMMPGAVDGDMVTPEPVASLPTDPQAIAGAAERVRDASSVSVKLDDDGMPITGYLFNDEAQWSGSNYTSMSQYYRDGSRATAVMWYDEGGNLQVLGGPFQSVPLSVDPYVWPFRFVRTDIPDRPAPGVTRSSDAVRDHGLGEQWRGIQAVNTYDGGGTLTFTVFTDLEEADNPGIPTVGHPADDANYRNIVLTDSGVPDIPAGQDGLHITIPASGLRGTLDGVTGTFSCESGDANYCALEDGRHHLAPGFNPAVAFDPVKFTPDDGSAEVVLAPEVMELEPANYQNFGNWLFIPEDHADAAAFDFGVFAGGDDPFMAGNLQGLTGTSEYEGESVGMYAETTDEATITRFNAKVELTADFGMADDLGSIVGRVYDFNMDGGQTSPLAELTLGGPPFWRDTETSNIFQTGFQSTDHVPGGFIEGDTSADGGWQGRWGGKFFGNGDAASDHPTSFAGTFGATEGDRSVVGSFGADRQ